MRHHLGKVMDTLLWFGLHCRSSPVGKLNLANLLHTYIKEESNARQFCIWYKMCENGHLLFPTSSKAASLGTERNRKFCWCPPPRPPPGAIQRGPSQMVTPWLSLSTRSFLPSTSSSLAICLSWKSNQKNWTGHHPSSTWCPFEGLGADKAKMMKNGSNNVCMIFRLGNYLHLQKADLPPRLWLTIDSQHFCSNWSYGREGTGVGWEKAIICEIIRWQTSGKSMHSLFLKYSSSRTWMHLMTLNVYF